VNVLVVGAGIIGHAVAWELASRGARVNIVDPRGTGQGASRASAGVLAPAIEGHSETFLRLASGSLGCYDAFIARLRSESDHPVEYRRSGTLQVALDDAQAAELDAIARRLEGSGVAHTLMDAAHVHGVEPSLSERAAAGLLIPEHGYVRVPALLAALADAASRRGVSVSASAARRVERDGAGLRLVTADGTLTADAVVLAAGAWSGDVVISPSTTTPVRPIRGQLLQLQCPEPLVSRVIWGRDCYLVPWRDGSLLVGATVEDAGFDERATAGGVEHLLSSARALLPAVSTAEFHEVRVGLRPATADELPIIGPSSTMRGVFYATGHYRNGVLLAPLTAAMLGDLMLDGRERQELALVRPDRFGL
jgi:glycine oxidase